MDIDYGRLSKSEEMQQQTAKPTSSLERQSQIHNMMMENEETIISTIHIPIKQEVNQQNNSKQIQHNRTTICQQQPLQ